MKHPYLKKKLRVCVVVDNAGTRFSYFAIFAKIEKFAKPFLPVHVGLRSNIFIKK